MTAAVRDADRVLADIDRVLASWPIDLDDLLCHPGQLVVDVAKSTGYQAWLAGDIDDDELQEQTDAYIAVELECATARGRAVCWLCQCVGDDFCEHCQATWAGITDPGRVVHEFECLDDAWSQSWKQVGPEVDGIRHFCARYHQHMAALK